MISKCDNCNCKNGIIIEYYDESDTIIDQYPCEDCTMLNYLDKKYNGFYTWTYDDQNKIIDITNERK